MSGAVAAAGAPRPLAKADWKRRWAAHVFTLACLAVWIGASYALPPYLISGPLEVAERTIGIFADPYDRFNVVVSLLHVLVSVAVSFLFGAGMALLSHYVPVTRMMIAERWYPFLNSFSGIGWAVVAVLWFGPTHITVIFAMSALMIPFVYVNIIEGLGTVDEELLEMARSFTRRSVAIFFRVVMPSLYPFVLAALRISFGVAWKSTLLAELFGANEGLGFMVNQAREAYDSKTILAVILIIVVMVYLTDRCIFGPLQKLLARHHAA